MLIIQRSPTWLENGAIVPTEEELEVMTHALREERDRVVRAYGDYYGKMSIKDVNVLLGELEQYKAERGS